MSDADDQTGGTDDEFTRKPRGSEEPEEAETDAKGDDGPAHERPG
jgi:hypothetical protein